MSTINYLNDNGWREYPNQFKESARCFYKRFDTTTPCHCNENKGMQVEIAVYDRGMEMEPAIRHPAGCEPHPASTGNMGSRKQGERMTPEQQRIALAKACSKIELHKYVDIDGVQEDWEWLDEGGLWHQCHNDDPLQDLNAINAAEQSLLTEANEQRYFEALHDVAGNLRFYRATAAQRAEALLRAINKWEEA